MEGDGGLSKCCVEAGLTDFDRTTLVRLGWSVTRLATLHGQPPGLVKRLLVSARELEGRFAANLENLFDLVERADVAAKQVHLLEARQSPRHWDVVGPAPSAGGRKKRRLTAAESGEEITATTVGWAKRIRWQTRLERELRDADGEQDKEAAVRDAESRRWCEALHALLQESGCSHLDVRKTEGALVGVSSRRVRKHVKVWRRLAWWLEQAHRVRWPQSPAQLVDYLWAVTEGATATVQLDRVMRTLCFMEELAGATEEQRLSRSVEVQDCVSEAKQRVEAGGSAGWEPARCLPIAVLVAWEEMVCSEEVACYARVSAWHRLVRFWAALGWEAQHLQVPAGKMAMTESGLCGEVRQFAPVSNGAPELRRTFYICFIGGLVQMSKLVEHWVEALV